MTTPALVADIVGRTAAAPSITPVPTGPTTSAASAAPASLDPLSRAVERQAAAARAATRAVKGATENTADPQAWLFAQRRRYLSEGSCDPYAEMMLRRAGFLPGT